MITLWKVTRERIDATARMLLVQLRGVGDEGNDATAAAVDDATVYAQLGIAVRPVIARTLRAIGVEYGAQVAVLKLWDKALAPTDLEAGETRLYAAGAVANALRLLAARAILEAPEIRLGAAATKAVNRTGDAVSMGTLAFAFNPVGPTLSIVYTPASGAVQTLEAGSGTLTLSGVTGPGSAKVKAED